MNTCESCRFWNPPVDEQLAFFGRPGFGSCSRLSLGGEAQLTTEELDLAFAAYCEDASDYKAELYCKPGFGCALWKERVA